MLKSIDSHPSIRSAKLLREKCSALNFLKLLGFCHDISFQHGQLSMLTTHEAVFRVWLRQRLPAIFTNEEGRTLEPGIYLGMILDEKDGMAKENRSLFLSQYSANQSIHIIERDHDCQHMYSFLFNQPRSEFLHWVVNHVHLLQNYICNYKYQASELIREIKKPIHRISLPIDNIKQAKTMTKLNHLNVKIIHNDSEIPIYLAKQQSICFSLLFEGMSAREIADRMHLSSRTVQHYLARIRQILGCRSNKELIIKYANQFSQ